MADLPANYYISFLYRYGQRFFYQALRSRNIDIEVGQFPFFIQVLRHPGITQESICHRIGMDKGTTARGIQKLEAGGYLYREVDADDRRVQHLYATDKGSRLRQQVEEIIEDYHQVLYKDLTPQETTAVIALLQRMRSSVLERMDGFEA